MVFQGFFAIWGRFARAALVFMAEARTPVPRMPLWLGLWPGLPQLWLRGSLAGLAAATGFAALLDFVLATSLVWTDIWGPIELGLWWGGVATVWLGAGVWWIAVGRSQADALPAAPAGDLFPLAMTEYLRGNWIEAERRLGMLLRHAPQDVEARLLRVSILRRTGKRDEARRLLDVLRRSEAATKWQFEMDREKARLEEEPDRTQRAGEIAMQSREAA